MRNTRQHKAQQSWSHYKECCTHTFAARREFVELCTMNAEKYALQDVETGEEFTVTLERRLTDVVTGMLRFIRWDSLSHVRHVALACLDALATLIDHAQQRRACFLGLLTNSHRAECLMCCILHSTCCFRTES